MAKLQRCMRPRPFTITVLKGDPIHSEMAMCEGIRETITGLDEAESDEECAFASHPKNLYFIFFTP